MLGRWLLLYVRLSLGSCHFVCLPLVHPYGSKLASQRGRTIHNPPSVKAIKTQTLKLWMCLPLICPYVMSWPLRRKGSPRSMCKFVRTQLCLTQWSIFLAVRSFTNEFRIKNNFKWLLQLMPFHDSSWHFSAVHVAELQFYSWFGRVIYMIVVDSFEKAVFLKSI